MCFSKQKNSTANSNLRRSCLLHELIVKPYCSKHHICWFDHNKGLIHTDVEIFWLYMLLLQGGSLLPSLPPCLPLNPRYLCCPWSQHPSQNHCKPFLCLLPVIKFASLGLLAVSDPGLAVFTKRLQFQLRRLFPASIFMHYVCSCYTQTGDCAMFLMDRILFDIWFLLMCHRLQLDTSACTWCSSTVQAF